MGVWQFLTGGVKYTPESLPANLVSPFSTNSLQEAITVDFWQEIPATVITPELALRVPEVKRALQAHTSLVAPLKFEVFKDGEKLTTQPYWVSNSSVFGVSPYVRQVGMVKDLFLFGQCLLGATVNEDDTVNDFLHIPRSLWDHNGEGGFEVNESIPLKFRQRLIWVPLGSNGLLVDGIDSVRQARKLELARQARLDAPPAATELHITDPQKDEMTREEKAALVKSYVENRAKHSVSVTPSSIEVIERGTTGQLDLFEAGMNSLRLQLANHSGVPASFIEGAKEGGNGGQMSYTNENNKASELWVFGSSAYALAIASRLSMDDVVGEGAEVRADLSLLGPAPVAVLDPEPSEITE
ncbi:hypothetical protein [Microbacterium sp. PRC9]|uniref:hypothetical protein n=1 Tax=Microbacterium sp. PRC9 TaxID=2962591 RepID=UPI0028826FEA|nr:hypothetical protein [Microbacterium sp. PRC9]MDT0142789.1 hypothetical protein [Microbacterium sp. PRC9]